MKVYSLSSVDSLQGENQRRLYKDLMTDYNPLVRPVSNDSQTLTVHFGFSLMQIMDVVRKLWLSTHLTCIYTAHYHVMMTISNQLNIVTLTLHFESVLNVLKQAKEKTQEEIRNRTTNEDSKKNTELNTKGLMNIWNMDVPKDWKWKLKHDTWG